MKAGSDSVSEETAPARGLRGRVRRSLPGAAETFAGAAAWAALMAASAYLATSMQDWETTAQIRSVAAMFALGGALSFPVGLFAARLISLGRSSEVAFAAAFLAFAAATMAVTGLIFAFDYRAYYAEWHAETGSITWVFQLIFTTLAALYQFAVLGLRLLFPIGFVALFAISIWFARMPR